MSRVVAFFERGSSPLTRGKPVQAELRVADGGLIPAHAGKTSSPTSATCWSRAHPRSRGENCSVEAGVLVDGGSSPLTRGKPCRRRISRPVGGLIPAHAGKTLGRMFLCFGLGAHPRSRGENLWHKDTDGSFTGSSPLTRGKLRCEAQVRQRGGLIPAHAGKTRAGGCRGR